MPLTRRTKAVVVVLACAGAVAVSALVQTRYTIAKPPIGQLLWHDDEAYLVFGDIRLGWEHSYLAALVYGLNAFGTPVQASTRSTVTFRISSTNESEWHNDGHLPSELIGYGDHVSAGGIAFVNGRFDESTRLIEPSEFAGQLPPREFSNVNGWSKRRFMLMPDGIPAIDFTLAGRPARLLLSDRHGVAAIDLDRGNGEVKRLWSAPTSRRGLSKSEFDEMFGAHRVQ